MLFSPLISFESGAQGSNQVENDAFLARLTKYEVAPEFEDRFRKALSDYVLYSIKSESNILSEAYYEQDKPPVLWLIERWKSKADLEKISKSHPFKMINSLTKTALLQPATSLYVKDLEPLSKQQWRRAANKGDTTITVMLFVESKPGTEAVFEKIYHTAMPAFRSEPGVINYQLSRFEPDETKFVTYEKFRNEVAFQYHLNFPPVQPVIDYLNTSIREQPFQKGLHRLIAFAPVDDE